MQILQMADWLAREATKGWATVEVKVSGLELVDSSTGPLQDGQGHLHYHVDVSTLDLTVTGSSRR